VVTLRLSILLSAYASGETSSEPLLLRASAATLLPPRWVVRQGAVGLVVTIVRTSDVCS
jgi:hypothetical protein